MPGITDNLTTLRRVCHASGVALVCLCAVGFHFLVVGPLLAQRSDDAKRIEQLQKLLRTKASIAIRRASLTKQLADLRERAESIRRRVPATPDEAKFLGNLAQLADEQGLQILDYRRGRVLRSATHLQLEIGLKCTGSYASVCAFLDGVARLPRISSTKDVLIRPEDTLGMRSVDLVLDLFYGMRHDQPVQEARRG